MKKINLSFNKEITDIKINLNSSKSESNRLLIIKYLSKNEIELQNLSNANDTLLLANLLSKDSNEIWDAEDAGTTYRFLTSYLALKKENINLIGTERMKKRPIKILVDSLNKLGAEIYYLEKKGYPPITIKNKISQVSNSISVKGNISSQYISSLLMISPLLPQGLTINIDGPFYSKPYVMMTLHLMKKFGIKFKMRNKTISILNQEYKGGLHLVESDWSAASYWYSIISINKNIDSITLNGLKKESLQGDSIIAKIMNLFNVKTKYLNNTIILRRKKFSNSYLELNFKDCPDLAQTILVIAAFHNIKLKAYGVESLKIKETNRLLAMSQELNKIGALFHEKKNYWILENREERLPKKIDIDTYDDHRMAMAFAPLSSEINLTINNPDVVKKSYPNFWEDLKKVGYNVV